MPAPDQTDAAATGALEGRLLAGRYRLIRPIASGGMAQVWEATDQTLARRVAVKLLHPHLVADASFVARFRGEAVAAARLAHPSIVSVYDTFTSDGVEAIVMELVVGTTMRADLDAHGPMRLDAVLAIGSQVADALAAAHAAGLVHRDVKPANILLSADGRVLVADFGIAKAAESTDLTSTGAMVGTAKYLAPEQVEGAAVDARTDVYALGVVLYEAITGQAPFQEANDAATALARLHRYPRPPRELRADLPAPVEAVVMQAMARDPGHRFASAAAMRTALLRAGADPGRAPAAALAANTDVSGGPLAPTAAPAPAAPPPPPPPPAPRAVVAPAPTDVAAPTPLASPVPRRRRSRRWMVVVGLVALAAVAAVFAIGDEPAPGEPTTLVGATSFDPQGDNGSEREDLVANLIDGDPTTSWQSETYEDPVDLAGKDGVGVVVGLDGVVEPTQVELITPAEGWSAQVYVAEGSPGSIEGWGPVRGSVTEAAAGTTAIRLDVAAGDHVLVWFTRLPASGAMEVAEVRVRAR